MNTALRLAEGEVLYRDVGYSYGPLPTLIDGFLLRTFGRSLDVLVAWRTVLALLGVEALRRIARRLIVDEAPAAAVCSSLAWLARRVSARPAFTALVLGLCVAQIGARVEGIGLASLTFVKLPGVSLFLLPSEARFVTEAARVIRETVPEGGTVGIFPEPGFLLFVTGRKNPFVDELFVPGIQDAAAEDLMIRRLRERPPDALLVTNRAFPEFGGAVYGNGLLDRFFLEVSRRYVLARRIGGEAGPVPLRHASEGLLFVPRPGQGP